MKRTWTIIGVGNVPGSFKWYQTLFGQPATLPADDYFGQVLDSDGTVLICLHEWGAHAHPPLMSPDQEAPGNGLLLFFRVDDFDLSEMAIFQQLLFSNGFFFFDLYGSSQGG